ncbi:hypothetical protein BOS5A_231163 [Bosea sp. EC-HK365B]|nr:hypothetical protein BOSE21B_91235 [Bosea sp. 21B]VVT61895.1 hypothetical protein BOS5A_231163 [Bosea sp. EC-HK365B]VXC99012.1 hypothetical protein BOSE127_90263 [Bosea sp. 127]
MPGRDPRRPRPCRKGPSAASRGAKASSKPPSCPSGFKRHAATGHDCRLQPECPGDLVGGGGRGHLARGDGRFQLRRARLQGRVMPELGLQPVLHHRPDPFDVLPTALFGDQALGLEAGAVLLDLGPERIEAGPGQAGDRHHRRRPERRGRRENMQRRLVLRGCGARGGRAVAIGLVDRKHVGELDDALLDALQFVAGIGQHQHQEEIGEIGDRRLRLADADRLDQDDVEAGGFAEQHGLARLGCDAPQRAGGGRGPDVGVRVDGELGHPGLVAEDRTAAARRGRIDREHRDLVALACQITAERVDRRRLADAGHAGDADPDRLAGMRQQAGEQGLRLVAMVGTPAFRERDRSCQRRTLAPENRIAERREVDHTRW